MTTMIFHTCRCKFNLQMEVVEQIWYPTLRFKVIRFYISDTYWDCRRFYNPNATKIQIKKHGTSAIPKLVRGIIEDIYMKQQYLKLKT